MINNNKIGEIIKYFRIKNGMSQRELGMLVGINRTEISKIEGGIRKSINKIVLKRICNILNINFDMLIQEYDNKKEDNHIKKYKVTVKETFETSYIVPAENEIAANDFVKNFYRLADILECDVSKESEVSSETYVEELKENAISLEEKNYIVFDETQYLL